MAKLAFNLLEKFWLPDLIKRQMAGGFFDTAARLNASPSSTVKGPSYTNIQKYSDTVIDLPGILTATWDGTSMATPYAACRAVLYWSAKR